MKKLFLIVALVGVVAFIAACAAPTPEPTKAPPPPAPTTVPAAPKPTDAPKPAEPTKPAPTVAPTAVKINNPPKTAAEVDAIDLMGKKVSITYWHNRPQKDQDMLQSMLDEFNKTNPYGITAKAEIGGASYNDVYNKVNAAIQAGAPPDISVAYQNQAAFYRAQGAVIDLTPFVKSAKYGLSADDTKDYFATFLASDANPQFKGEVLGFPTQRSMDVMFVNMDMLKKAGYDKIPTDWKTWEEAACKASDPANKKYGWTFRHDASNFASQVFSRGGRILAEDGSAYVFNSQAGIDTIAMIQRMIANKCAVEIPTSERYGEQNRFGAGEILLVFASSSGLPFYQEAVAKGGKHNWDIAMLPNTGKPAVNLYGASVSVYKTTPEKELDAWLVIKFLGAKEQTTRWAIATGYLPVRNSAKADVIAAFKKDPMWGPVADSYAKMFDWAQYSMIESPVAGYDPVRALIDTDVMSKVLADPKADVKALLDAAVKKSNDILKENAPK